MPKLYIDLTEDERYWDGKIAVTLLDRDTLTGMNQALQIGDDIEIVASTPQFITLFDVLDGWVNGGPIKAIGDIERRVMEAIKEMLVNYSDLSKAVKSRPDEVAHVLYDEMKLKGLRYRLHDEA